MGMPMLCYEHKAKQPFALTKIGIQVYTIEELSYCLYQHLYLVDRSIMSQELCDWLEQELQLTELAEKLRKEVEFGISLQSFVLPTLETSGYCTRKQLTEVKEQLQIFKRQTETERRKYRGDYLLQNKQYASAIREYRQVIERKETEKLLPAFLGGLYHNMGCAYARLFQYKEASHYFQEAYSYTQDEVSQEAYLKACSLYMETAEYEEYDNIKADENSEVTEDDNIMIGRDLMEIKRNFYKLIII